MTDEKNINLPVSEETLKGMSLNVNDIKWFKAHFDLQDKAIFEQLAEVFDARDAKMLREFERQNKHIEDQEKKVLTALMEQEKKVLLIATEREERIYAILAGIHDEMVILKSRNSLIQIAFRILISVFISILLILWIHAQYL